MNQTLTIINVELGTPGVMCSMLVLCQVINNDLYIAIFSSVHLIMSNAFLCHNYLFYKTLRWYVVEFFNHKPQNEKYIKQNIYFFYTSNHHTVVLPKIKLL